MGGSEDPAFDEAFTVAYELHQKGVSGDEQAVVLAMDKFRDLYAAYPERVEALAFLGSSCTLRARDVVFYRKMDYLREGFEAMDLAVERAGPSLWPRLIRGINGYQLPKVFGRRETAREDFGYLTDRLARQADSEPPKLVELIWFHAGKFAYQERDSRSLEWLERALESSVGVVPREDLEEALRLAKRRFG
ncbi:MAG: hypothetical protein ACFCU4_09700 [Puniceicoccaceae bacterium]